MEYLTKPWWRMLWQPAKALQSELVFDPYRGLLKYGGLLGIAYLLLGILVLSGYQAYRDNIVLILIRGYGEADAGDIIAPFIFSWPFGVIAGICMLYAQACLTYWMLGFFNSRYSFVSVKQIVAWSYYVQFVGFIATVILLSILATLVPPPREEQNALMVFRAVLVILVAIPLLWCWCVQWIGVRLINDLIGVKALIVLAIANLIIISPFIAVIASAWVWINP